MGMIDVRRRVMMAGMFSKDTATGNPLSFVTNLAKPLKSLVVPFTPIQQGTGDASPQNIRDIVGWNGINGARCGVNLFNFDSSKIETMVNSGGNNRSAYRLGFTNCTLTFTAYEKTEGTRTADSINVAKVVNGVIQSGATAFLSSARTFSPVTVTVGANEEVVLGMSANDSTRMAYNLQLYDIQIEVGSSDSQYEAYTGLPISCVFPAVGKNLFNKYATNTSNGYQNNKHLIPNGNTWDSNDYSVSEYIPVSGNTSYTISPVTGGWPAICFYDSDKVHISGEKYDSRSTVTVISPANAVYARVSIPKGNIDTLQLEKGSSATAYETFTNTVYGGSLNLTTGVLTATMVCCEYDGSSDEAWDYAGSNPLTQIFIIKLPEAKRSINGFRIMCNQGKQTAIADASEPSYGYVNNNITSSYNIRTHIVDTNMSVSDFRTYLSQHPLQIVCPLTTPITYQLTPQQITTLIGTNTIWSDTNGSNTAVYLKR